MIKSTNINSKEIITIRKTIYVLYVILLISGCHCNKSTYSGKEIILFLGERAAGKSTLCNSIFGQAVFKSGLSLSTSMTSMTNVKQEHIYEGKLYIDTPGFEKAEISDQVSKSIDEALKYNNNYKIVFVVKLDEVGTLSKRIIDSIDEICNAIQTNFEYGIVFNQISKRRIKRMSQEGVDQGKLHESIYMPIKPMKLPSLTVVLEHDNELFDEDNKYFQANDENRKKLLNFLNKLHAHKIAPNEVSKIK